MIDSAVTTKLPSRYVPSIAARMHCSKYAIRYRAYPPKISSPPWPPSTTLTLRAASSDTMYWGNEPGPATG